MLPSVPMQNKMEGFTLEEYLHYLSWRIEVQLVAQCLNDWRRDGDKQKASVLKAVQAANKRSEKFPAIEMPNDIVDPVTSGRLDLHLVLKELTDLLGNVPLTAGRLPENIT